MLIPEGVAEVVTYGFENGIDASAPGAGDSDWWFFKGSGAVKVRDGILKGPLEISDAWPELKGTVFANGVDAAVAGAGGADWWFFKGDQTIKCNGGGKVLHGPDKISVFWPALKGTVFEDGVDAAVNGGDGGWWFFRGNKAALYDNDTIVKGPGEITAAGAWPKLKGTQFEYGVNAAAGAGAGSGWWFFLGNQTIKCDGEGNALKGPEDITAANAWSMLKGY
ncbi:hypothetical protein [Kitasatospora sp. NPDC098663]|uniref:hypothetical protein n=1 Tax=Kitasatospora sp. NPDC098663 TaxID=3364096 RepID=UPI0037F33CF1